MRASRHFCWLSPCWEASLLSLDEVTLEWGDKFSWTPLFSQAFPVNQVDPRRGQTCSPELQDSFAVHPPCCPKDLELQHFMVTAPKAVFVFQTPHPVPPCWSERGLALHLSLLSPLSLWEGSYHQHSPGTSCIVYALLCCPSNRYHCIIFSIRELMF